MPNEFIARNGLIAQNNSIITGSLTVTGTITATTLVAQTVTSSTSWITGSTKFGSITSNTHQFTGSIYQSGSEAIFAGDVSIGTTSDLARVTILSDSSAQTIGLIGRSADNISTIRWWNNAGNSIYTAIESNASYTIYNTVTNGYAAFFTNNTERMRILSGGNVGINTTSPNKLFTVKSTTNDTTTFAGFYAENLTQGIELWYGGIQMAGSNTNVSLNLASKGAESITFNTSGSERMRITGGGNVGIGTTSPSAQVHVNSGGSYTNTDANNRLILERNSHAYTLFVSPDEFDQGLHFANTTDNGIVGRIAYFHRSAGDSLNFSVASSIRMIILADGNVGIGSTSPAYKLDVIGAGNVSDTLRTNSGKLVLRDDSIENSITTSDSAAIVFNYLGYGTGTSYFRDVHIYNGKGSSVAFFDGSSGNVGIGSTSPGYKLDVSGTGRFTGDVTANELKLTGAAAIANTTTGGYLALYGNTGGLYLGAFNAGANQNYAFINASTGNVGIGTTSPGAKFHVSVGYGLVNNAYSWAVYNTAANGFAAQFGAADDVAFANTGNNAIISATGGNAILFGTNSTERMRITSAGNVGIGSTSPSYLLDVVSSTGGSFATIRANNGYTGGSDGSQLLLGNSANFTNAYFRLNGGGNSSQAGIGSLNIGVTEAVPMVFYTSNSERMRITSGGNVGIGTTSPTTKLQVNTALQTEFFGTDSATPESSLTAWGTGALRGLGTGSAILFAVPANTDGSNIWAQARILGTGDNNTNGSAEGAMFLQTRALYNPGVGGSWNWRTNMVLRASGNVGIGTTNPLAKFHVNGISNGTAIRTDHTSAFSFIYSYINGGRGVAFDNFNGDLGIYVGDSYRMYIVSGSGNVGIGTTSPSYKLDVVGSFSFTTGGNYLQYNSGILYHGNYYQYPSGDNYLLYARTNGALIFGSNDNERMRITSAGNVGIGVTSPTTKLDVIGQSSNATTYGILTLRNSSEGGLSLGASSTSYAWIQGNVYGTGIANIALQANGGSVGIGTTSAFSRLTVNGALSQETSQISLINSEGGHYIIRTGIAGIANQGLVFLSANQDGTGQTSRLVIDSSGNVGIGTTSPAYKLTVSSDIGFTTGASLKWGANTYIYGSNNTQIEAVVNGNYGIFINSNGNVGIGTSSPGVKLDVNGSGIRITNATPNVYFNNTVVQWKAYMPTSTNNFAISDAVKDVLTLGYNGAASYFNGCNVGVGTTAPASLLHVSKAGNTAGGTILMGVANDSTGKWSYLVSTQYNSSTHPQGFSLIGGFTSATANTVVIGGSIYEANPATDIQFWTHTAVSHSLGGSQRMVINNNGNVGIGTGTPSYKLDVAGSARANGMTLYGFTSGTSGGNLELGFDGTQGVVQAYNRSADWIPLYLSGQDIRFNPGGVEKVRINSNGNVGIGTTSPSSLLHTYTTTAADTIGHIQYENANAGVGSLANAQLIGKSRYGTLQLMVWENYGIRFGMRSTANGGAGDIYFTTGTDSTQMVIKGGNVGIGNTSPSYKLEVSGELGISYTNALSTMQGGTGYSIFRSYAGNGSSTSVVEFQIRNRADSADFATMGTYSNHDVRIRTNNTDKVTIQAGGNVGIGNTSPSAKLDVSGYIRAGNASSTGGSKILWGNYGDGAITTFGSSYSSGGPVIGYGVSPSTSAEFAFVSSTGVGVSRGAYYIGGGTHYWYAGAGQTVAVDSSVTMTTTMVLNSSGNLGIGTTSPDRKLEVYSTSNDPTIRTRTAGAGAWFEAWDNTSYYAGVKHVGNNGARYWISGMSQGAENYCIAMSSDGSSNRFFILNTSGNVGIGTTAPGTKLDVNGSINAANNISLGTTSVNPSIAFTGTSVGGFTNAYINWNGGAIVTASLAISTPGCNMEINTGWNERVVLGTGQGLWIYTNNGSGTWTNRLNLDRSGNLTVSADMIAYGSPSDISLKTNIKPLEGSLEKVMRLQGVSFTWKEDTEMSKMTNLKDDIGFIAQAVQEVIPEMVRKNDNGLLSLRDKGITALLVEAIKELKAEINELKNKQ